MRKRAETSVTQRKRASIAPALFSGPKLIDRGMARVAAIAAVFISARVQECAS